jgi:hypothetical protein
MKQNVKTGFALLAVSTLLLAGCTSEEATSPEETAAPGGETNGVVEQIDYAKKWENNSPEELLFPRGEYTFTYSEAIKLDGMQNWNGEGKIAFYEDGTCAFDFAGVKVGFDGKVTEYRLVKPADTYPMLETAEYSEAKIWINDPLLIESSYRTNFPAMGAFPKYKDFASFCSLQKLADIGQRGGAALGFFFWEAELGAKFAAEGKDWYYDFMLSKLEIEPEDYQEAREVLELMYYGTENIFTFDGQGKVEVNEDGTVVISTGLDSEDNLMTATFVLTPTEEKLVIDLATLGAESSPATLEETMEAYLSIYDSGMEYLRSVKKSFDDYAASQGNTGETSNESAEDSADGTEEETE